MGVIVSIRYRAAPPLPPVRSSKFPVIMANAGARRKGFEGPRTPAPLADTPLPDVTPTGSFDRGCVKTRRRENPAQSYAALWRVPASSFHRRGRTASSKQDRSMDVFVVAVFTQPGPKAVVRAHAVQSQKAPASREKTRSISGKAPHDFLVQPNFQAIGVDPQHDRPVGHRGCLQP